MNEILTIALASMAGAMLGVVFFGGLWFTVRRGMGAKQPALWFLGSLLLRTGVTLTGLYFVSGGRWQRMLACLAGFIVARVGVTWLTRAIPVQEVKHAA